MQDASDTACALYDEALLHARQASALAPASAQAHRLGATLLREKGELEAAHEAFAEAYARAPDDPDIAADYASSLQSIEGAQSARRVYDEALAKHPGHAALHAGYALTLLGAADYARGWEEYEWRLKVPEARIARPFPFPFPTWTGEALAGRTLFLSSEQGLGDEIMFASCFEELIGQAGHCVIEVSHRLAALFRRSFPDATVVERSLSKPHDWSRLPPIDVHIAAGSVPRFLRRSPGAFPQHRGYLQPDPSSARRWGAALADLGPGLKVGLAWTGGLPGTLRAARSLPLADLAPLLDTPAASFVSLELADPRTQLSALPPRLGSRIAWWPQAARNPDELAGLLCGLDVVISVPTASAHLAGALGKPVWVLVPRVPTWRYLWSGERLPWYPSATVLRRMPKQSLQDYISIVARRLEVLSS